MGLPTPVSLPAAILIFFLTKALHFLYLLNLSPTPTTSLSLTELRETKLTLNFMAPFFGIGSTVSRLQSHYETEIRGNHLINLGMIKGWVDLGTTQ